MTKPRTGSDPLPLSLHHSIWVDEPYTLQFQSIDHLGFPHMCQPRQHLPTSYIPKLHRYLRDFSSTVIVLKSISHARQQESSHSSLMGGAIVNWCTGVWSRVSRRRVYERADYVPSVAPTTVWRSGSPNPANPMPPLFV